ncbi:RNA-binding S4 domain-containing protein [Limibacter armeniacum]|uniref:RNA-binding S4 domain-containing protein n=1 Tax=Limibacter armeniacum TaxID=466084 RepID=UPI002FE5FCC1
MLEFNLREGEEYIQLNHLLKIFNLVMSGGEAKIVIREGEVLVNDEVETRVGKKLYKGDTVSFAGKTIVIND